MKYTKTDPTADTPITLPKGSAALVFHEDGKAEIYMPGPSAEGMAPQTATLACMAAYPFNARDPLAAVAFKFIREGFDEALQRQRENNPLS